MAKKSCEGLRELVTDAGREVLGHRTKGRRAMLKGADNGPSYRDRET